MDLNLTNIQLNEEKCNYTLDHLVAIAYERLHNSAKAALGYPANNTSIQATELVNELYLYLRQKEQLDFKDSSHFFAIASLKLRHILLDQYRKRTAKKRNFGIREHHEELDLISSSDRPLLEAIIVENLIERLEEYDKKSAAIASLLIFWEFSFAEVASMLHISERTVHRKWRWAIAWFQTEIS